MAAVEPVALPDVAWGLGIGTTLFVLGCGAFWGALHLRGKVFERLHSPVELAKSGLAEKSMRLLRLLRDELDGILPASKKFDPSEVTVDPSSVEDAAREGVRAIRQQAKIGKRFEALLRVSTALVPVSVAFPIGVLAATFAYFALFNMPTIWAALWTFTAVAGLSGAVLIGIYGRYNSLVQRSIEDASSDVDRSEA